LPLLKFQPSYNTRSSLLSVLYSALDSRNVNSVYFRESNI